MTGTEVLDLGSAEYQAAMQRLCLMGQILDVDELDRLAATIDRCHSVGPILYPSDYHRALASGTLEAQAKLIEAARAYRRAFAEAAAVAS